MALEERNLGSRLGKSVSNMIGGYLFLLVIGLIAGAAINGFEYADRHGHISHEHDTPVWIAGDWLVGEYRDCQMRTPTVPKERKDLDSLDKLPRLFCAQDANGLFDFQRVSSPTPPPADTKAPPLGWIYFVSVTGSELDQYFHTMPVHYSGRIDRTDKWVISWRCQRNSESLTCKALN